MQLAARVLRIDWRFDSVYPVIELRTAIEPKAFRPDPVRAVGLHLVHLT